MILTHDILKWEPPLLLLNNNCFIYELGEAEYIDDIPKFPGELHAAFVLATLANCELDLVDPSPALVKN